MKKISCTLLSDITNFLKTISDIAFKAFDRLNKLGVFTEDMKETDDGGFEWDFFNEDKSHKIHCIATPVAGKDGYYDVSYESEDGDKHEIKDVAEGELEDAFGLAVEALYGDTVENWVTASCGLNVALKRIVGGSESSIELCGIRSSLPVRASVDILSNIMVDEFVATIPEEETWYAISDVGDEFDVNECEPLNVNIAESLYNCLWQAFSSLSVCQAVHWNARGKDFFTLHEKLNEYIGRLQYDIDELAELIKEQGADVPAPSIIYGEIAVQSPAPDTLSGFDIEQGFTIVYDSLKIYCETLDCYYVNMTHDIQSILDEKLGYWNKETQYKLTALLS